MWDRRKHATQPHATQPDQRRENMKVRIGLIVSRNGVVSRFFLETNHDRDPQ